MGRTVRQEMGSILDRGETHAQNRSLAIVSGKSKLARHGRHSTT
jgi:hypothetical protein